MCTSAYLLSLGRIDRQLFLGSMNTLRSTLLGNRIQYAVLAMVAAALLSTAAFAQSDSDSPTDRVLTDVPKNLQAAKEPIESDAVTNQTVTELAGTPSEAVGMDQKIDQLFKPVADYWGSIVFFSFPGISAVPFVLILLVFGRRFLHSCLWIYQSTLVAAGSPSGPRQVR